MDRRECTHASYSSNSGRGSIPRRESSFILLIDLVINVKRRETKVGEKGREKNLSIEYQHPVKNREFIIPPSRRYENYTPKLVCKLAQWIRERATSSTFDVTFVFLHRHTPITSTVE